MNKPAFRSTTSKAAFQWDPNSDQIYGDNGPPQRLHGAMESFNKAPGKTFTMDAPQGALILEVDSGLQTTWAGNPFSVPTIYVKNGLFTYNGNNIVNGSEDNASLVLADPDTASTILQVENSGHLLITGISSPSQLWLHGKGALVLSAKNSGVLEIDCGQISFGWAVFNITVEDQARLSTVCGVDFYLTNAFVTVSSAPDAGYSLNRTSRSKDAGAAIIFVGSVVNFIGNASGLLRSPVFNLQSTPFTVNGKAKCFFQFDSFQVGDPSRFNLGTGGARMQSTAIRKVRCHSILSMAAIRRDCSTSFREGS